MQEKTGLWHNLHQTLASLKLTVFIFLTLAACSVIGTLLPQGLTEMELQRRYSSGIVWWIDTFGLNDLYHTGWFRLLMILLCINLIVCTLQRLPKTMKLLKHREDQINPQKLAKFNFHSEFSSRLPWEDALAGLTKAITEEFGALQQMESTGSYSAVAENGRWSRLMVYVVHLSVLVVLLGALMGSLLGFKGFMNIAEGETTGEVMLSMGHQSVKLPFEVRCDKFDVSFYDTGAPKEFRSDLTIVEDGRDGLKQSIIVNDPLTYQGVTFYQASYGSILKRVEAEFRDRDSGKVYKMTLPYREPVPIPGTSDKVQVVEYQQDFSRFGKAVAIALMRDGEEPAGSWILVDKPDFHGNRIQNYQIRVTEAEQSHYTGLQVKRDPGVWVVWFGFVAMLVGIGLTFYTSHQKLWIWAEPISKGRNSVKVLIAGRTSKNSLAFEQEFNRLCERLQRELKPEERGNK